MRYSICLAALLAGTAFATTASAAEKGAYIGLSVGVAKLGTTDIGYYDAGGTFGGSGATDRADGRLSFKSAAEFKGTVGYDFGTIRADLEIAYARSSTKALTVDSINGSPVTLSPGDISDICDYLEASNCAGAGNAITVDGSRLRQLSALGSLWVDLPIGKSVTPYVGAGLGVSGFEADGEGKAQFAWQLGAGVAFNISETTAITIDYRHREAKGTNIAYDSVSGFDIGKLKTDSVSAGVRFTF
ncbi:outer membrane protein [Sandarakinorhabdus sp. DWP1-3-1]|uniref:outer membrane protein n=1 Tax=Sandarakinorhabdus sp. DWP1-3-1 TaxID=2804627 RepID=UPI003CF7AF23